MRVFKQKELLFSMSDTEPLLRTSYNQQEAGTKEERSVLLNNNRWICLLPFARKPNPGRVSKQAAFFLHFCRQGNKGGRRAETPPPKQRGSQLYSQR